MLPQHITLYTDSVIWKAEIEELGIKTSGHLVYGLRYADGIALWHSRKRGGERLLGKLTT